MSSAGRTDIATTIRDFIARELLLDEDRKIGPDEPLLEGAIDSLGLMQLVAFVEEEFQIQVADADIVTENFATITAVTVLVERSAPQS